MDDEQKAPESRDAETDALRRRVADLERQAARREGTANAVAPFAEQFEFLQTLVDQVPSPVYFLDADGGFLGCNRAYESYLGLPLERIAGRSAAEFVPPDLVRADRDLIACGGARIYEAAVRFADGSVHDVVFHKAIFARRDGATAGLVGVMIDLTDWRRTERALRESEERYRTLVENMGEGIGILDPEERFLFANPAGERIFGVERGSLEGRSLVDFLDDANRAVVRAQTAIRRWGEASAYELEILRPDGERRTIRVAATPRFDAAGGFAGTFGTFWDITDRKRAVEALRASEENIRAYLNATAESAILVDAAGTVLAANKTAAERLDVPLRGLLGADLFAFFPEDLAASRRSRMAEVIATGAPTRFLDERAGTAFDISYYPVMDAAGRVARVAIFGIDVTARKRAEEERARFEEHVRQTQRIEAIGRLAGGIAHDFNNFLTSILGAASLLRRGLSAKSPELPKVERIEKSATQAAALTNQLLAFARGGPIRPVPVDLDEAIQEALELIPTSVKRRLRIVRRPGRGLKPVDADPAQLVQVVMNLCQNAAEAMGERGAVTIETRAADPSEAPEAFRAAGRTYNAACTWDTGPGIPEGQREHVFDPFFTTKDAGRGLGLSVVYGIVQGHGGWITCDQAPGGGARFTVFLPASSGRIPTTPPSANFAHRPSAVVLVVEGEKRAREMAKAMLESLGHRVLAVASGKRAADVFRRNRDRIDMVLLDAGLAGDAGAEVLRKILHSRADARIVIAVDFHGGPEVPPDLRRAACGVVTKPFDVRELGEAVRDARARGPVAPVPGPPGKSPAGGGGASSRRT